MVSEQKDKYYTTADHLLKYYDKNSRKLEFRAESTFELNIWKDFARQKLREVIGLNKMQSCELFPRRLESVQKDGFRRDKVLIQTEPEVWMPMYILIPDGILEGEKRACVIAPHGHGGAGKESIAGNTEIPEVKERIEIYSYDYGVKFVKEGYVVFCSDARGAGERREWMSQGASKDKLFESSCNHINFAAISMGQSLLGMMTWDLIRVIDYIGTLDYCNSAKIACAGFSGGGLQALWLGALDDRINCTVVSGYFHGFRDSVLKTNLCGCNFVPGLWEQIDVCDLGALIAPRPLLIESGKNDPLNGKRGIIDVLEQVAAARKAYKLYDKSHLLYHHMFDGGHMWNGEKTYEFINRYNV